MLLAEAIGRAVAGISSLVELGHRGPVADYEEAAPAAGLLLLYNRAGAAAEPLLADVGSRCWMGTSQFGATAQAQPVTVVRTSNSSAKSRIKAIRPPGSAMQCASRWDQSGVER